MLYCPNFFWNVLQVWMTGKDVYLQMTWSWPDKTWNILCSYCLQWNTSQSKFRNHYFLFLFAFSILSQLFLIWGCISFFTSCTQPCPSDLSVQTHPVCDVCVRTLWLTLHSHGASASTLDGGRVWSMVLTQLRGIFAHYHRSCRFWTVYSRIMMTSFKQTRLLSCIVFLYERSMYPFHSSVTSQTHMPQLHPPHPASLPPNHVKNNRSRNSLLRHDTGEKKKRNLTMTKD